MAIAPAGIGELGDRQNSAETISTALDTMPTKSAELSSASVAVPLMGMLPSSTSAVQNTSMVLVNAPDVAARSVYRTPAPRCRTEMMNVSLCCRPVRNDRRSEIA